MNITPPSHPNRALDAASDTYFRTSQAILMEVGIDLRLRDVRKSTARLTVRQWEGTTNPFTERELRAWVQAIFETLPYKAELVLLPAMVTV